MSPDLGIEGAAAPLTLSPRTPSLQAEEDDGLDLQAELGDEVLHGADVDLVLDDLQGEDSAYRRQANWITSKMNSIALKHVPTAVAGLLDEYHRTQHADNITKTAWRDLTSSDLQAVVQTVDPDTATAYCVSCVHQLFLPENPDIALSYRWSATLGDIYDGLCSACKLDDTVWIDILFNGQNAELTPEAVLELTPKRYQKARRHILLVTDTQVNAVFAYAC